MVYAVSEIYIALASTRLSLQVEFYSALLSTLPSHQTDSYAEFRISALKIAIFVPQRESLSEFSVNNRTKGPMSLCLEVKNLQAVIAQLTALGYPPPGDIIHASHGREIYAYDPDGNRLILHQS